MLKWNKILIIFSFMVILISCKKEVDIKEDFTVEVDYKLENSTSTWKKRGVISFLQKSSNKNYKPSVTMQNDQLTKDQIEEIKSECKNGNGLYYIRIKSQNNIYFSQINTCELLNNNLFDRFIINHFGPIKNDQIISISYDIDYTKVGVEDNNKNNFKSSIDYVHNFQTPGPQFPEEKEKTQQQQQEQSFFQKYWWIMMIVMFMMMMKGPAPEEGASGGAEQ